VPVPYADGADPQTLNLYGYVLNLPTTKSDIDGHGDAMTHYWQCQGNSSSGCAAANHHTTVKGALVETAVMGAWFGGGLLAPTAGPLARGLIGLGLVTAPTTVPIAQEIIAGATPGSPSFSVKGAAETLGIRTFEKIGESGAIGPLRTAQNFLSVLKELAATWE
jgi:hypothetical protein